MWYLCVYVSLHGVSVCECVWRCLYVSVCEFEWGVCVQACMCLYGVLGEATYGVSVHSLCEG